jgi:hypothetical protein
MRTIPEIVADMKALIAEFEQHTELPTKKEYTMENPYIIKYSGIPSYNFDNMNMSGGIMPVSHYENDTITLSPTETITPKF